MKKLLCLMSIIVIVLAIHSVSLAVTLTDIKGTKYEEAVNNLVEVGLVNGFEDNTYRPQKVVTRAELAKMMVIALGAEDQVAAASKRATVFKDMANAHWAYGYVNVARDIGIINGYTDGTFQPEATVSYAEATTMAVRALGYEPKVNQSKENWPTNYINVAKELSMFKNINAFQNDSGAARGDVGILLWNMLNTGVCVAKSSTNSGINYGQGEIMLSKYKNFVYMNDGMITAVDFEDDYENATVTVKGNDTVKLSMSDTDVLKYFGKTLTILYNTKTKKVLSISAKKNYKEETGEITKLTSKKISIDDEDYALPSKENIILYKAESLSEAIEATVYLDGKTVKYILASGAKEVDVALVTASNVTVSKKDGITIKKIGSTKTVSYALTSASKMPSKYAIVLYYLTSSNELGIVKAIDPEDASLIASVTSSKIKVGKTTYTYDEDDFKIVAATTSTVKTLSFSSIDEDDDMIYVYKQGGKTYLIVFTDAAKEEENKSSKYKELQSYITTAASKEGKEASYSQATFATYLDALKEARAIKSTDSVIKMSTALDNLKSAYTGLKSVTSTSADGKIAAKRAELRKLVNGTAATVVKDKAKYTSTTYSTFSSELNAANKVLAKSNTTLDDVTEAYNDLNSAIKKLALVTDTKEYQDALNALNTAIEKADKLEVKEHDYTEKTYKAYKTAYDNATAAKKNASSKSASELSTAAKSLETAIEGLEVAIDSIRDDLYKLIVECIDVVETEKDYLPETYAPFETAYESARKVVDGEDINEMKSALEGLEKAKKKLVLIDDALTEVVTKVEKMKTAEHVKEALETNAQKPEEKISKMKAIQEAAILELEELVQAAKEIAETDEEGNVDIAIGNAKKVLNATSSELDSIVKSYTELKAAMEKLSTTK